MLAFDATVLLWSSDTRGLVYDTLFSEKLCEAHKFSSVVASKYLDVTIELEFD